MYKLRNYLKKATEANAQCIASFGGPYFNYLVALAYTAKTNGFKSIGYVRSNQGEPLTPSLQDALDYGMEIRYLGRSSLQQYIFLVGSTVFQSTMFVVDASPDSI